MRNEKEKTIKCGASGEVRFGQQINGVWTTVRYKKIDYYRIYVFFTVNSWVLPLSALSSHTHSLIHTNTHINCIRSIRSSNLLKMKS